MGKAKERHCLVCKNKPSIKGDSWSWHCQSKHTKLNKDNVKFKYASEGIIHRLTHISTEFYPKALSIKTQSISEHNAEEPSTYAQTNLTTEERL
jgi:hypothetical protein